VCGELGAAAVRICHGGKPSTAADSREGSTRSDTESADDVIVLSDFKVIRNDRAAGSRPAADHEGMIMMVMGAVRPGTIKIKATIAADEVDAALAAYHLSGSTARNHEIYFCEQPSQLGLLPLLDGAVILRVRHHPAGPGDVTVKLRPCQPEQLSGQWSAFRRSAHHKLLIKGEWAHDRHLTAASLVYSFPGDHLRQALRSRPHHPGRLFSTRQRRYLAECTATHVDLDGLYLLGPVTVQQWRLRVPRYDITAERWTILTPGDPPGLNLLELSVTAESEDAALVQPAFLASIRRRGLDPYAFQRTKTRYVLQHLVLSGRPRPS